VDIYQAPDPVDFNTFDHRPAWGIRLRKTLEPPSISVSFGEVQPEAAFDFRNSTFLIQGGDGFKGYICVDLLSKRGSVDRFTVAFRAKLKGDVEPSTKRFYTLNGGVMVRVLLVGPEIYDKMPAAVNPDWKVSDLFKSSDSNTYLPGTNTYWIAPRILQQLDLSAHRVSMTVVPGSLGGHPILDVDIAVAALRA
jgi:hypothetical protein